MLRDDVMSWSAGDKGVKFCSWERQRMREAFSLQHKTEGKEKDQLLVATIGLTNFLCFIINL